MVNQTMNLDQRVAKVTWLYSFVAKYRRTIEEKL